MLKLSATTWLKVVPSRAGKFEFSLIENLDYVQKPFDFGLNRWKLFHEFYAETAQANDRSRSLFISVVILALV